MTTPYGLPPVCVLYVDGARFADGSPGFDLDLVALDNLRIRWGRDDSISQPSPTSCQFRVLDTQGGQAFLGSFHMGVPIRVHAEATIFPDPTVSTLPGGGFESPTDPYLMVNGTSSGAGALPLPEAVYAGTRSLAASWINPAKLMTVAVPPGPFSSVVTAWDALPRTKLGQTWHWSAKVRPPSNLLGAVASIYARPVGWRKPYGPPATLGPPVTGTVDAVKPEWLTFDGDYLPTEEGIWLGVQIEAVPGGPNWNQLDSRPWAALGAQPTWAELGTIFIDEVVMFAPAAGALRSGVVFEGRLTDMEARYDIGLGGTVVECVAQDAMAELGNRFLGVTPWPAETLIARWNRILGAVQQVISGTVDTRVQPLGISKRDIDRQPSLRLLQELATSAGGVLWCATHEINGDFLYLEDIGSRPALLTLYYNGSLVVIGPSVTVAQSGGIELDACDVLLAPTRWVQATYDDATRVSTTWLEQASPDVTSHTEEVADAALEARTGQRRVSVSTQLSGQSEAISLASELLGRLSVPGWRVSGLTIDLPKNQPLDAASLDMVMQVLDGYTRLGLPMILTNLPPWSPVGHKGAVDVPLFLEGAAMANVAGAWTIELITSNAQAQGTSLVWNDLPNSPDWNWDDFDPAIAWMDLQGVRVDP